MQKNKFLISQPKHMLWVLKRTVSLRLFFRAPKTYAKKMDKKIIAILRQLFLLNWPTWMVFWVNRWRMLWR